MTALEHFFLKEGHKNFGNKVSFRQTRSKIPALTHEELVIIDIFEESRRSSLEGPEIPRGQGYKGRSAATTSNQGYCLRIK